MSENVSELMAQANRVSDTLHDVMAFRKRVALEFGANPRRGFVACRHCGNYVDWIYDGPRTWSLQCRTRSCVKAIG